MHIHTHRHRHINTHADTRTRAETEPVEGMWIGPLIYANLLTLRVRCLTSVGILGSRPMRAALFRLSTLPPARLSSSWAAATGVPCLPSNSQIRGRAGMILPPSKLGMDPFCRYFRNRMLCSSRTTGVSNRPLGLIAPSCL